ncbi:MAG TPA: efflux transporter outer membrane subunit [Rhizobacter sp.]|nr:efflux transporter outer membrane subunit [Rhizobacter sp.]
MTDPHVASLLPPEGAVSGFGRPGAAEVTPSVRRSLSRPAAGRLLACAGVLLAGCALQPPPAPDEVRKDALGEMNLNSPWRAGGAAGEVQDNWLVSFGDTQLNALVTEALQRNPDLRVAAARVEQASSQLALAKSAQRPSLTLLGTGGIKMSDMSSALTGVIALVSWELDLWGTLRYATAAASDTFVAAQADQEFARQSLAATTAKAWFTVAQTRLEQKLAEQMLGSGEQLYGLAGDRLRVGAGNAQDVALANANLNYQRDVVAQARFAHESARRALELLLGRYPSAELQARENLPALPGPVPAGLPLQMLERRPDLIAAERRVAAAFNRVGQAKTASLPSLRLTGNVGYLDSDILQLKQDYENPSAGVGAKIVAPIDINGQTDAQVAGRTAQQQEAVAQYARLALRAIGDVENALSAGRMLAEREKLLSALVDDRTQAYDLAQSSYKVGRQDLRSVEQQQLNLYEAQILLLRVRSEQLSQRVGLHLALGGSFASPPSSNSARAQDGAPVAQIKAIPSSPEGARRAPGT